MTPIIDVIAECVKCGKPIEINFSRDMQVKDLIGYVCESCRFTLDDENL